MSKSGIKVEVDARVLHQVIGESPDVLSAFLDSVCETGVNYIKARFNTGKSGRVYQRGQKTHTASAPGQPPAIDTGALINSVRWERTGALSRQITDGVEYGKWLEIGTEKMAARPWMRPAFEYLRVEWERMARQFAAFKKWGA